MSCLFLSSAIDVESQQVLMPGGIHSIYASF